MERGRILGAVLLAAVTAGAIGYAASRQAEERAAEEAAYQAYLDALPLAEAEGETCSPNGRFQVRTAGESDLWIGGVRIPEALEIVDTETGEVRWEDAGYVRQSVLWSPGNNLVVMACGARTWGTVYVVSTAFWTTWEFTLPDGTSIPDYTFLPEDWGRWLDENTLLVTVGQGGDAGEQHTYRCILRPGEDGTFDLNWDQPWHTFDTEAVAAFLVEIHGLLDGARPLLDTGWGELPLGEGVDYGDTGSVRVHLEALAAESRG